MEAREKLGLGTKVGYGIGDFGTNLVFNTTTIYLLYYYTDVFGISATFEGTVFLVAKLWNAIIDPVIGHLADHTNSPWGRKRPWILFGALPFGIAFFLAFSSPGFVVGWKEAWAMGTYILFCTTLGIVNIPYSSLTATMTRDLDERSTLSGFRMTFALVGTMLASVLVKPVARLFPGETAGFRGVGFVFGVLVVVAMLVTFFTSFEKPAEKGENRVSFHDNFRAMARNRPFILLAVAFVMCTVSNYLVATTVNYYFKYVLLKESLIQYGFLALFLSAIASVPLWLAVARRWSKRAAFVAGSLVLLAALIFLWFASAPGTAEIIVVLMIAGVGICTFYLFPWAMVPDTVEFSEWKSGVTQEGYLYGFFIFGIKLAQAFAGFVVGFALDAFGYVANVAQPPHTMRGITFLMTLLPAIFLLVGLACLAFYPINPAFFRKMTSEIAARKVV